VIKEANNIDFYTTGRQPSEQDFVRISEWIRVKKEKALKSQPKNKSTSTNKSNSRKRLTSSIKEQKRKPIA